MFLPRFNCILGHDIRLVPPPLVPSILSVCSLSINLIHHLLLDNQQHDRLMAISICDDRASPANSILIVEVTRLGTQEWEARLTLARIEVNLGKLREANSSYAECLVSLPCFHYPAMHICTSPKVQCSASIRYFGFHALKVALCWNFPPHAPCFWEHSIC